MTLPSPKQRIVLAASEVVGLAKTGGLADVVGSLPPALVRRGHECAVFMPLYRSVRAGVLPISPTGLQFAIPIRARVVPGSLWKTSLPGTGVPVYLIEQAEFFERDDPREGRGLYQYTLPAGQRRDYPDNCERFVFFCRAVLQTIESLGLRPTILHANDWQTGLLPVYLREEYQHRPGFGDLRSLFTIHNIGYQGTFWHWDLPITGLDWKLFNHRQLEFYGQLCLLKGGIVFSDMISTVSPTYAREIQTAAFGCGLEGVLTERRHQLFGIVNGVDYGVWDPATDRHLVRTYGPEEVVEGKRACKKALQTRFGLTPNEAAPLLGVVARLAHQKGIDLISATAEWLLAQGAQLVVLGEGEPGYHVFFEELKRKHPEQVGVFIGFDEPLAHQIEAGSDIFLMPSLYEPSGLNQLYSLKYGAVPVVRATGGLADTIVDCNPSTLSAGLATGFLFTQYAQDAFRAALERALKIYREEPQNWLKLIRNGMRQDWSWDRVAVDYERLYAKLSPGT